MAEQYGVLGQAAPAAATVAPLVTVATGQSAVVSTLTVCNRGDVPTSFRVAVRPNGEVLADRHHVYFDAAIGPKVTVAITIGMTLGDLDVLEVRGAATGLSFSAFGTLILPDVA